MHTHQVRVRENTKMRPIEDSDSVMSQFPTALPEQTMTTALNLFGK